MVAEIPLSVRGAAPKWIIQHKQDSNDWYMAKGAELFGAVETCTELFINQLGVGLKFPMAHSGLMRVDGELRFVSRNFLKPGERLTHGSLMLQDLFQDDLESVGKNPWDEQRTFDIDLIREVMDWYCKDDCEAVMERLIELLVFDALTGSMDRHMQNWGIRVRNTEPISFAFAPIFDSARALLWNCDEAKLQQLLTNEDALQGYVNRARPKIGCLKYRRALNHFELVRHLKNTHPQETGRALTKVTPEKVMNAARIVQDYPFVRVFSRLRRKMLLKVLDIRSDKLKAIAEGRAHAVE